MWVGVTGGFVSSRSVGWTGVDVEEGLREVEKGAKVGVYGNVFLSVLKVVVGFLFGSWALISDGAHSASDVVASAVVLFAARFARKPPDERHMYGHYKIEPFAGLVVSSFVVGAGLFLLLESLDHLFYARSITSPVPLAVALFTIGFKEWMYRYTVRIARRVGSKALEADARHHRSDVWSSAAAAVGIAGSMAGYAWADPAAGAVVSLAVVYTGLEVGWESFHDLLDVAPEEEVLEAVHGAVEGVLEEEGVKGEVLFVRGRRMGLAYHLDVVVAVDPDLRVRDLAGLRGRIVERIREVVPRAEIVTVEFTSLDG